MNKKILLEAISSPGARRRLCRFLGSPTVSIGRSGVIAIPSEGPGAQVVTKNVREAAELLRASAIDANPMGVIS